MRQSASDASLISRVRASGDAQAYAQLYDRHADAARAAAYSIAPGLDRDEVVSESFTRTLQALRGGTGPTGAFRPYLYQVVRSVCRDFRRAPELSIEEVPDGAMTSDSDDTLQRVGDRQRLSEAFASIPERWREVLWYTEVEGMAPREVAPLLGLSANHVSQIRIRASAKMRLLLGADPESRRADRVVARSLATASLGALAVTVFPALFVGADTAAAAASTLATSTGAGQGSTAAAALTGIQKTVIAAFAVAAAAGLIAVVVHLVGAGEHVDPVGPAPPETPVRPVEPEPTPEPSAPAAESSETEPEPATPVDPQPDPTVPPAPAPQEPEAPVDEDPGKWVEVDPQDPVVRGPAG